MHAAHKLPAYTQPTVVHLHTPRRVRAGSEPPAPQREDCRRLDERVSQALRAATAAGFDAGERIGYIAGWRWGLFTGGALGMLAGVAAVVVAVRLGVPLPLHF